MGVEAPKRLRIWTHSRLASARHSPPDNQWLDRYYVLATLYTAPATRVSVNEEEGSHRCRAFTSTIHHCIEGRFVMVQSRGTAARLTRGFEMLSGLWIMKGWVTLSSHTGIWMRTTILALSSPNCHRKDDKWSKNMMRKQQNTDHFVPKYDVREIYWPFNRIILNKELGKKKRFSC